MTASEMELKEHLHMALSELEETEGKLNTIMDTIENHKQIYSDTMQKTHDTKEKEKSMVQWHTLKHLQKDIEQSKR